jgi:2-polyprenyl-3-methyl-5-hydroxy-6-metoxy-1,4-benzoquinol methylase
MMHGNTKLKLDSSFVSVPTLPRTLASFLLLAFSLFELVARYRSVCVQKTTRRMEKSVNTHNRLRFVNKQNFLITGYVQVRTYDLHCNMCHNNNFFHCLCSALMEKHDCYCSVIP